MKERWRDAANLAERRAKEESLAIRSASEALYLFLQSEEWVAARALLKHSRRRIVFGEEIQDCGYTMIVYADGYGLQRSYKPHGRSPILVKKWEQPDWIQSGEAIRAAVNFGGKKPEEILGWLTRELDRIADDVMHLHNRQTKGD